MGHLESAQNGDTFTVPQVPRSLISITWPAGYLGRAIVAKPGRIPVLDLWCASKA